MATTRMSLLQALHNLGVEQDPKFVREAMKLVVQAVMEIEASMKAGTERYERSEERQTYRNGYRTRRWDTPAGTLEVEIPKLRRGSYFPSFLEPRRRTDKALHAVIQEAYVLGVSTRKVDDLVKSMGLEGISKSEVSRLCHCRVYYANSRDGWREVVLQVVLLEISITDTARKQTERGGSLLATFPFSA